ncbi:SseB family protein [Nocardioides marmorisolisilvae]|uniref:SseB family protein n=1 Tax=Nocardioides marmorisolisilvae TaxID=1542737 RepID=A0A3N0DUE0_9ACTN|nr:SseB family protein [Nocardioides marmorisolisilvae]RNL79249.1 SseB family protein [Nocardioides marmorisolisilvae]
MGSVPLERVIPDPGFADDDGNAPAGIADALAAYDADPDALHAPTLALLQDSRVLVPVVAVLGEVEYDENGLAHDKTSDMATVLITGRDGRTALLSFTSTASLTAWNPEARPVAVTLRKAALSAIQDGADAIVLDIAGPVLFAVEGPELRSLAEGLVLQQVQAEQGTGWGWTRSM